MNDHNIIHIICTILLIANNIFLIKSFIKIIYKIDKIDSKLKKNFICTKNKIKNDICENKFITVTIDSDFNLYILKKINLLIVKEVEKKISIKFFNTFISKKNIGNLIYIKNLLSYTIDFFYDIDMYMTTSSLKFNKILLRPYSLTILIIMDINYLVLSKLN
jgi:hypothetical protein